jgi:hypothetical protein
MTARRMRRATTATPRANLVDRLIACCDREALPALGDDCTVNTLRAVLRVGQEDCSRCFDVKAGSGSPFNRSRYYR